MITISKTELVDNGYTHIVSQKDESVVLRRVDGNNELFAIRESYSGWCLEADDGRVLEFCRSLP